MGPSPLHPTETEDFLGNSHLGGQGEGGGKVEIKEKCEKRL